ncbi:helix-turn-helix domain-containing protein [Streptacidiphilus rugosus]|uniref:helix-turn-helix domain-containing protein n=1 Tax=Streptacidiphilus rugosus TaxID=405783 RepID=UPI0005680F52
MNPGRPAPKLPPALTAFADVVAPYADLLSTPDRQDTDSVTPKHKPVRGVARVALQARARAAYQDGATIREVASLIGRSYGATYTLLAEAGVLPSRRTGAVRSGVERTGGSVESPWG